jgi:hypothetical protein
MDFEQRIFLYDELTSAEQTAVEKHVLQCASCKKLWEQARWQQALLRHAATQSIEARNPANITHRILRAIRTENKTHWSDPLVGFLNTIWMRSALTAFSVFLILYFLSELQLGTSIPYVANKTGASGNGMVLKTSRFLEVHNKKGTGSGQGPVTSLFECMKKNDCSDAFRKFNKLIKNYENI